MHLHTDGESFVATRQVDVAFVHSVSKYVKRFI